MTIPELPPRPDSGYPPEFFDSWGGTADTFVPWLETYMSQVDDHSDYVRWLIARRITQPAATKLVSVRLPDGLVAAADAAAQDTPGGRTGVIRRALEQYLNAS